MGRQQDAMKMADDGRVMIPKYIRMRLNLKPGDIFDIILEDNVIKLIPKIDRRQSKWLGIVLYRLQLAQRMSNNLLQRNMFKA